MGVVFRADVALGKRKNDICVSSLEKERVLVNGGAVHKDRAGRRRQKVEKYRSGGEWGECVTSPTLNQGDFETCKGNVRKAGSYTEDTSRGHRFRSP